MPSGRTGLRTVAPATLERSRPVDGPDAATRVLACTGEAFLTAAALHLARTLPAPLVFMGELDGQTVRTAVVVREGRVTANFVGSLARPRPGPTEPGEVVWLHGGLADETSPDARGCFAVIGHAEAGAPVSIVAVTVERVADVPGVQTLLPLFAPRIDEVLRTEREAARRERDATVRQQELVGRLAGGVAHDFNNLLMIMTGYAEMLRDRHGASEELGELLAAGSRASALVGQLLAYGRRQVLHPEPLDLNRVAGHVAAVLSQAIGTQVRLECDQSPGLPAVRGDAARLEQVVLTLALGARDAMPDGGTLTIETAAVHVDEPTRELPSGPYACVRISDTGTALPAEAVAHIFEPFSMRKGTRGNGLDLAGVRGVVLQSGGVIQCESVPGRGTTFFVYLPALV